MNDEFEGNNYKEFEKLSIEKRNAVLAWIDRNLLERKTFNLNYTSYGLKHVYERWETTGDRYLTNGEFKGAMLSSGYKARDKAETNWVFNISERSPALKPRML